MVGESALQQYFPSKTNKAPTPPTALQQTSVRRIGTCRYVSWDLHAYCVYVKKYMSRGGVRDAELEEKQKTAEPGRNPSPRRSDSIASIHGRFIRRVPV